MHKCLILNFIYISIILVIIVHSNSYIYAVNELAIESSHQNVSNKFDIII